MSLRPSELSTLYSREGFVSPVSMISGEEAREHRHALEVAESEMGPLHYIDKIHTVFTSPLQLAIDPGVLDVVESFIGPDILLYNVNYIIKEPQTDSFIAWHQDLTYWGLTDDDAQVSMWLALSPATTEAGCMTMIPGSHQHGRVDHEQDVGDANLLLLGQRINDVDGSAGQPCPLAPGQASFHHGWTVHTSAPNHSDDRRIGLNVQYLAPHNAHVGGEGTAMLVRGEDRHNNFGIDLPADRNFDPDAVSTWHELDRRMKAGFKTV